MQNVKKKNCQLKFFFVIFTISFFLLCSSTVYSAVKYYYYLQVGSFRKAQDAKHLAEKLRNVNENTIIRGEKIAGKGYSYRVYLGSFSSWQGASSKLLELTKKGIFFDHIYIQKKKSPIQSNLKEKPVTKKMQKGYGRNIPRSNIALGLNHTYVEVQTEVTKRTQITFDGTTTDIQDIPLGTIDKNEYPTSMHIDTIRVRFGLTDYLEIFADIGIDYDEDFDPGTVYGGGTRLNLYKKTGQSFGEFYIAFQGEYLTGTLTKEYKSSAGSMWELEADWQWLTGRMELGVVRSRFAAYIGGVYFYYREDTERNLMEPAPYISFVNQDELEEEYNYGVYGGVGFHFSPAILLNIEGQFINQKSFCGTLEYHF